MRSIRKKRLIIGLLLVAFLLFPTACANGFDPNALGELDGVAAEEVETLEGAEIEGEEENQEMVVIAPVEQEAEADLEPAADVVSGFQGAPDWLMRAFYLLEMGVDNLADENIGEVEDLVIDLASGEIVYVILEYGGVLDIGDADKPLPLSAFAWEDSDDLVLLVEEEALAEVPSVEDDWPTDTDPVWEEEVERYWVDTGFVVEPTVAIERPLVRAEEIIGYPVADIGIGSGTLEDLLIDLASGRAQYAVINYVPTGYSEVIVVPLSVFDITAVEERFVFNAELTPALLEEAPVIEGEVFLSAQFLEPGLEGEIVTYWGERGYPVEVDLEDLE